MKTEAIDFENGRVKSLFYKILFPTLLGTISMSAVTAIDGIFIGHGVGADGVAAVNIIVPIYQIVSGIGLMIGVGCSVVASINMAKQKLKIARLHIAQALGLMSLFTLLLCGLLMAMPYQTATLLGSSATLMPQVIDYLLWITIGFLFEIWSLIGLFIIRLDGSPRYAMWCNIVPALLNAVLDWLFIFPLGMGVKGAAIATTTSLMVGGVMALIYMMFFAGTLRIGGAKISWRYLSSAIRNIAYQCKIGSSTLLGELMMAVLIFVGNLTFMKYLGDAGVGAFGIACYYAPFFFMVGNAIAQSAQPIISYNYGISRWRQVHQARKLLLTTSLTIGAIVALLFVFIPDVLVALFVDTHSQAGAIAVSGFPYYAIGVIFFILNVAIIGYYQSVERIRKATFYVFLRGFIFLVPGFILLPQWLDVAGIWLAMPTAEMATTIVILAVTIISRKSHQQ